MIEALETKYFVNATGEYIGGFSGVRRTIETLNPRDVVVTDPDTGAESTIVEYDPPIIMVVEEWPDIPAGAVEVPLPPISTLDRFEVGVWVSPDASVVEAEIIKQAIARIDSSPEISALIEAVAARLSIPAADLMADVASNLVVSRDTKQAIG